MSRVPSYIMDLVLLFNKALPSSEPILANNISNYSASQLWIQINSYKSDALTIGIQQNL